MDDRILRALTEYHAHLRQVGGSHMTWFSFHVTANLLILNNEPSRNVFPAWLMAVYNAVRALATWPMINYYRRTAGRMRRIEGGSGVITEVFPLADWVKIACALGAVCLSFAAVWACLSLGLLRPPVAPAALAGS